MFCWCVTAMSLAAWCVTARCLPWWPWGVALAAVGASMAAAAAPARDPRGGRAAVVSSMSRSSNSNNRGGESSSPGLVWATAASLKPIPRRVGAEYALPIWSTCCRILHWAMFFIKRARVASIEEEETSSSSSDASPNSMLDLPDLALDSILCRLPADSLLRMGGVCREFRSRCRSDHLWEALVYEKWGKLAGPGAYREWYNANLVAPKKQQQHESKSCGERSSRIWSWLLTCFWPLASWWNLARECSRRTRKAPPLDSLMAWYWALETGNFWFRAQVYNREHGHVGFLLSCYDAELSYDRSTDSFRARYPPHGPRAVVMEENIPWERLRAPPVATPAHSLHTSDCLAELRPGNHIEVQWRRSKEFPYGWWYGVVGHSDLCNERHCSCHTDNTVWLVFNQYTSGSRWRRAAIDRRTHREEGNEAEGFYGGVRKLRNKDEISVWESLWPAEILE